MAAPWTETTIPAILSKHQLKDLFNADEFALFFQCLPKKKLNLESGKCPGSKKIKIRLEWAKGLGDGLRIKGRKIALLVFNYPATLLLKV